MSAELVASLNRLAGTSGLAAAGAANAFAGTSGMELVGALNAKAGTSGLELNGVCNRIAGTSGVEAAEALARSARPDTPATPTLAADGIGRMTVSFAAVTATPRVTGFTAMLSPGGLTGSGASSPITIDGTVTLTSYRATVRATNLIGDSADSDPSAAVTSL
jgi:hypothetical protein